jgi:hypothetical protein
MLSQAPSAEFGQEQPLGFLRRCLDLIFFANIPDSNLYATCKK